MSDDEHQRERMRHWARAFNDAYEINDSELSGRAADFALAEFDKRFPAPSAVAPVEPVAKRVELYDAGYDEGYKCGLRDGGEIAEPELAALRQKARLWDAVGSGKVVLLYDDRELFAGRYDKEDSIGWQTGWFPTAEEAVEAAIAAGALK